MLLIMAPQSHEILSISELSTDDARGVMYSPDGNWLALLDTASAGYRVVIVTADGHHFKTLLSTQDELTLGVRCMRWSPTGDYLAIGDHESTLTLFGRNTFTPRLRFLHPQSIEIPNGVVWQEELGPSRSRSYTQAKQPATSPSQDTFQPTRKRSSGIALMEFNHPRGDLLASSTSDTPSTLWIHSIGATSAHTVTALIHQSPIKALFWHPVVEDLLLVQCAIAEPTVYLWKASWNEPKIVSLSFKAPVEKLKAMWLASDEDRIRLILSTAEQSAIKLLTHEGEEVNDARGRLGPEAMFDEGNSFDQSSMNMQA
ncbi:MAG: hypothetical protein Q9180_009478, partial [Flavoplaca navasiana]